MSEQYPQQRNETGATSEGLSRLERHLNSAEWGRIDPQKLCEYVDQAFDEYLYSEFGLVEDDARRGLLDDFRAQQLLPCSYEYDVHPTEALEMARLAIFTAIAPLYSALHTPTELEQWLPSALKVAVPESSRHTPEKCVEAYSEEDGICRYGLCPIRVIAYCIEDIALSPDYAQYGYKVNETATYQAARSLLSEAMKHHFVTEDRWRQLDDQYTAHYTRAFKTDK